MMKNIEYWTDIEGYEGSYQISSFGRVRRHVKKPYKWTYLKPYPNRDRYLRVGLCLDYKRSMNMIHRLVAEYFVENPLGLKEVNHLDGNKQNNHYTNLEWCTRSENIKHAIKTGLKIGINKRDEKGRITKGNQS